MLVYSISMLCGCIRAHIIKNLFWCLAIKCYILAHPSLGVVIWSKIKPIFFIALQLCGVSSVAVIVIFMRQI